MRFRCRQRKKPARTKIKVPKNAPTTLPAMIAVFVDELLEFGEGDPGEDDEVEDVFVVDGVILC